MWRFVYSKYKLKKPELTELDVALNDHTYTCGASLSDICLPGRLADVVIRLLRCYDPLEKLYYSRNRFAFIAVRKLIWLSKKDFTLSAPDVKIDLQLKKECKHCLQHINIDLCVFLICSINNGQNVNNGNTLLPSP